MRRDERDRTRAVAPLIRPPDAHLLDTTHLDIDAAVRAAIEIVEAARAGSETLIFRCFRRGLRARLVRAYRSLTRRAAFGDRPDRWNFAVAAVDIVEAARAGRRGG